MSLLSVSKLTKHFGADQVFANVSFQVTRGEKVALLGVNGAGKSTLLKIIAGLETADDGDVYLARETRVAYLAQDEHFGGTRSVWGEMEAALAHLKDLEAEMALLAQGLPAEPTPQSAARIERYGDLLARFEHAGGFEIEPNIKRTLRGLGFGEDQYALPVSQLSGGQKTRAALAATLLSDPDLLLLDEPTNHLDLEAMEWLDGFLKTWPGTLIVISHDRHFLDQVTSRTLELAFGGVEDYPGSYSRYLALKTERLDRRQKEYESQQQAIARTEEFIRRYGAGQRSKEAKGREKRLNRLKEQRLVVRPQDEAKLKLSLENGRRSGELVLSLDGLEAGYAQGSRPPDQDHVLVRTGKLLLRRGERIALIGPNGCGKTTLLRTVVGELAPLRGQRRLGHNVVVGYFAQGHEALDPEGTVLAELLRVEPDLGEAQARNLLAQFLFGGDDVFKRVRDLSGGERSRLALAQLMLRRSNLLIMDEPTNHLDVDAREALQAVLKEYAGSLLFVSHDRYLIDALAEKIWLIHDGRLVEHLGNYDDLARSLERLAKERSRPASSASAAARRRRNGSTSASPPAARRAANDERKRQRCLSELECAVDVVEQDLAALQSALESASAAQDAAKVAELGQQYVALERQRDDLYQRWVGLSELPVDAE